MDERPTIHGDDPEAIYAAMTAMAEVALGPLLGAAVYAGMATLSDVLTLHPEVLPAVAAGVAWGRRHAHGEPRPSREAMAEDFIGTLAKAEATGKRLAGESRG